MSEAIDTQRALWALERLQVKLKDRGDSPMEEKLSLLKALLQSPVFHQILTQQTTLCQCNSQQEEAALSASSSCPELKAESFSSHLCPVPGIESGPQDGWPAVPRDLPASPSALQTNSKLSGSRSELTLCHLAQGRYVTDIELSKGPSEMLGFTVGSLKSDNPGLFIKGIQIDSAAYGKLKEGDQILAINGQLMDQTVTQQMAMGLLQDSVDKVLLRVARGPVPQLCSSVVLRVTSAPSMGLSHSDEERAPIETNLQQTEKTELVKSGSAVVKGVLPGGAAVPQDQVHCNEEVDTFDVELTESAEGLGMTIADYLTKKNSESLGIFVKNITKDGKVEQDGQIHVSDKIVAVDNIDIQGYSSQHIIELLRLTGQKMVLKLLRRAVHFEEATSPAASLLQKSKSSAEMAKGNRPSTDYVDLGIALEETPCHSQTTSPSPNPRDEQMNPDVKGGAKMTVAADDGNLETVLEDKVILSWDKASNEGNRNSVGFQPEGRRHHGASTMPGVPVGQEGVLQEVNGRCLSGETAEEGQSVLEELPASVFMTTSSPAKSELSDSCADQCVAEDLVFDEHPDEGGSACTDVDNITGNEVPEGMVCSSQALWTTEIQHIELEKGDAGLGFSILDYQDPVDPAKTVMVILSLVPNGVADLDGRLLPGDRLISVNDTDLADASLEEAVWVLKGAAPGTVRLSIAKPLPMDSNEADLMNEKAPDPHHSKEEESFQTPMLQEPGGTCRADLDRQMSVWTSVPKEEGRCVETANIEASDKQHFTSTSNFPRTVTVVRGNSSLGMTVSALKDGSGMVVRSIVHGGSISQDGRLAVGDTIVAINGEPTFNLTNAEGRAKLRKHSLAGPEISLTYVPAEFMEDYRAGLCQLQETDPAVTCEDGPEVSQQEEDTGEHSDRSYVDVNLPRVVELRREVGKSLGISIVGGRGMGKRLSSGEVMRGIFIKHILEDSPAGRTGTLKIGDMILEVGGTDLRHASHERAAEAIRKAGDSVVFLVQSFAERALSPALECGDGLDGLHSSDNDMESDIQCRSLHTFFPAKPYTPAPFKPSDHREVRRTFLPVCPFWKLPPDIDTAQNVPERPPLPLSCQEDDAEDQFGYSWRTITQQYGSLQGAPHMIELEKGVTGLGLTVEGNRDHSSMRVLVENVDLCGPTGEHDHILLGEELLEINGQIPYGRGPQHASTVIESAPSRVKIIFTRNKAAVEPVMKCRDTLGPEDQGGLKMNMAEAGSLRGVIIQGLTGEGASRTVNRVQAGDRVENRGDGSDVREPVATVSSFLEVISMNDPDSPCSVAETDWGISNTWETVVSMQPVRDSGMPSFLTLNSKRRPIIPSCKTTRNISKEHVDLGLSMGSVFIHEVLEDTELEDGHINVGDRTLEVDSVDPRDTMCREAIDILRQTPEIRLTEYCDEACCKEEDPWDVFLLELVAEPGQELGLRLLGKRAKLGVFVTEILQGGAIEADGRLREGDRIISVNGEDVRAASEQYVTALLKCCPRPMTLQVARLKARHALLLGSLSLCSPNGSGCDAYSPAGPQGEFSSRCKSDDSSDDYLGTQTISVSKVLEGRCPPECAGTVLPECSYTLWDDLRSTQNKSESLDCSLVEQASLLTMASSVSIMTSTFT